MGKLRKYITSATRIPFLLYIDYFLSLKVFSLTSFISGTDAFAEGSNNQSNLLSTSTTFLFLLAGFVIAALCSVVEIAYVCDAYIFVFILFNIFISYHLNKELVEWILRGNDVNAMYLMCYSALTLVVNSIIFYLVFDFDWLRAGSSTPSSDNYDKAESFFSKSWRIGYLCLKFILQVIQCSATHLSFILVIFYICSYLRSDMRLIYYLPFLAQLPSLCFVVGFLIYHLPSILRFLGYGLINVIYFINDHGLEVFVTFHWRRLCIPLLLRLFWLTKCTTCLLSYYIANKHIRPSIVQSERFAELMNGSVPENATNSWHFGLMAIREAVIVEGSDNLFSLAGLTAMVSLSAEYLSILIAWVIGLRDQDPERGHFGSISAILFFLLALQSGITALTPEQRVNRLYRNFCLLTVGFLHFAENLVNSILKYISAGLEKRWSVHVRPLISCACLTFVSMVFVLYLWRENTWDPWLLLIISLCFEVMVKVFFSVLEYGLVMLDSRTTTEGSVDLENTIYWVNSTGHIIEFMFGLFFFANGVYIFATLSGGVIRACMLVLHAYFNVWSEACNGWSKLRRRRLASRLIETLLDADPARLKDKDSECCPICFMELELRGRRVKVTPCQHLYHDVCLRKWVQVKENCPLCHFHLGD